MPCYDGRDHITCAQLDRTVRLEVEKALTEARHNSPVAALLCEACAKLAALDQLRDVSPELLIWYMEHRLRDKKKAGT